MVVTSSLGTSSCCTQAAVQQHEISKFLLKIMGQKHQLTLRWPSSTADSTLHSSLVRYLSTLTSSFMPLGLCQISQEVQGCQTSRRFVDKPQSAAEVTLAAFRFCIQIPSPKNAP